MTGAATQAGPEARLTGAGIHKSYGSLPVLNGIDFSLTSNEAVGIIGPNGAGKSTLLSVLSGATPPTQGTIQLNGSDVSDLPARDRAAHGLVRTHQIPKPFSGITIFENVLVAATHAGARRKGEAYDLALDALDVCGMLPVANRPAESVGLLDRKRLELARALATSPRLLLLDEIGGGLTDAEASELVDTIRSLRARGIGIVWIEHIVRILLQVAERLVCMDAGRIIAEGDPETVMTDAQVVSAYLGGAPA
ncbi:ABC transporter ATP-binding protein [Sulfitobacter sp. 20_GPM-1509m]|uniref:ABC transporter ATP-binding protein n=1 Tax=Sulfitobacter sp. 20_GPM-1509m TaxID=1380367 RepID=UPI00048D8075|nr:ABC transporter ATP-binding protein [Sulfitobacter sp. 20_GPM-1509m]